MPTNVSYTTLVATLVLLLAVSSAIVVRSLILRRRHQRLVEEAIRTGTWLPNRFDSAAGRRRRDIGQKPKLWEAWLHPSDENDGENEHENEKSKWGDIMVSASIPYKASLLTVLYVFPLTACLCRICQPAYVITSGAHRRLRGQFRRFFITSSTIHATLYKETITAIATAYDRVADGWSRAIITHFISDSNVHACSACCGAHRNAQYVAETHQ